MIENKQVMKKIFATIFLLQALSFNVFAQTSPNGKVKVEQNGENLEVKYHGKKAWQTVMSIKADATLQSISGKNNVEYDMVLGKKSHCSNAYREGTYTLSDGKSLSVRVYNNGVAWLGAHDNEVNLSTCTNNWIMRWSEGYEDFFPKNRSQKENERYGYPALFEYENDLFALISESEMTKENAGTSMYGTATANVFKLVPDGKEQPGWQTVVIGTLADIVESTLITDNSAPNKLGDFSWIKPGVASWVYWAYNHGSNDFNIIKKYTDMAVALKLPYVLIDAEWDNFLPPYKVEDAIKYATDRGIKPMIWYSSSIGWINGAPGPKFRLNKPEDREREFAWCEKMGITGVKIDFFCGDTNQNFKFMIELLESAAKHHLTVNFHGATIPRGWQRTYPNLVSTEAIYGAEWYNNTGRFTDKAACHNATIPFTRNVIGSMDYTPCAFTDSQHPHITTHAHELALTALYESGIQHLADRPESFLSQPQQVKDYLSELPTAWDETVLLQGYPGESVVMARRKGSTWYIAGINGTDAEKTISFPTCRLKSLGKNVTIFEDGILPNSTWRITQKSSFPTTFTLKPRGGFVIVIK